MSLIEFLIITKGLSPEHADFIYCKLHTDISLLTDAEVDLIYEYYNSKEA